MKVEIYGSAESHTVRGATVNFNADSAAPVTEFVAEVNPNGFDGRTGVDINNNGTTQSVAFGKTCYGGSANVTTGTLTEEYGGGAYDPQNVPAEVKSEVESKLTLETATPGDIVSFDCELGEYPLNSLSFPLAPIQEGTGDPSPENVRPISGWTGANIHVADSVAKYGVQFNGSASAGTRLYDAVGKVANVGTDTQTATNDFDNILPWSAMRRCNTAIVNGERVPTYYEGEVGFDNVNSDVFVYCPLFFYYRSDDDNTHVVSMSPLNGYRAPSKFVKADGTLRPYVFLPAYTAGVDANGVPVSRPGYWPRCISLTAFMTLCKTKHTAETLDADIWIEGTKDEEIIRILLDIEFATRDHQTVMQGASSVRYASDVVEAGGTNECTVPAACAAALVVGQAIAIGTADKGNQIATNVTVTAIDTATNKITLQSADGSDIAVEAGHYISSRPWKSGACDSVLTPSGSPISNTNAKMPCKYRGIENPWGNQYRWRWDYLQNDHQPYVLDDPDNYTGSVNEHYTALSYTVAQTNGYAVEMGFDENFPHCRVTTSVSGGSSTTYFADYYYQASGVRALLVGGSVLNGRNAGARYCHVYGGPGLASWDIGAALSPA